MTEELGARELEDILHGRARRPKDADEFLKRQKALVEYLDIREPLGRPLREPSGAIEEAIRMASHLRDPLIRAAMTKCAVQAAERMAGHGFLFNERNYRAFLPELADLLFGADVYLWSNEMYQVARVAADEYPFGDLDRWGWDVLGHGPPGVVRCLYWAFETDQGLIVKGPEDSPWGEGATIYSQIIVAEPAGLTAFLMIADQRSQMHVLWPYTNPMPWGTAPLREGATPGEHQLYGVLKFLQSPYVGLAHRPAPRPMRRRAAKAGHPLPSGVSVIVLRHRGGAAHGGEDNPQEWSCRWLVRGHWRNQWYSKAREHHPIWVAPYVKGPEDRPLKMPAREVFTVVR